MTNSIRSPLYEYNVFGSNLKSSGQKLKTRYKSVKNLLVEFRRTFVVTIVEYFTIEHGVFQSVLDNLSQTEIVSEPRDN